MNETIFAMWLVIWVIFLVMSVIEKRGVAVFGFFSGLWILFLGVYIYLDGLEIRNGLTVTGEVTDQVVSYTYSEVVPPFNTMGMLWGLPFILLGIYILFLATFKRKKNQPA